MGIIESVLVNLSNCLFRPVRQEIDLQHADLESRLAECELITRQFAASGGLCVPAQRLCCSSLSGHPK